MLKSLNVRLICLSCALLPVLGCVGRIDQSDVKGMGSAAPSRTITEEGPAIHWSLKPLQRLATPADPMWDEIVTPITSGESAAILEATTRHQLAGVQAGICRSLRVTGAATDWQNFCHLWPVMPGSGERWTLATDALPTGSDLPLPEVLSFAVGQGADASATIRPYFGEAGTMRYMQDTTECPTITSPMAKVLNDLTPTHPLLQGRPPEQRHAFIRSYGQESNQPEAAHYGELLFQMESLMADAIWQAQDFPPSVNEALTTVSMTLSHGQVTTTEAESADLKIYFDGVQSLRFHLVHPNGLEEDNVHVYNKISLDDGLEAEVVSLETFEQAASRPWTFLGGIKLLPLH